MTTIIKKGKDLVPGDVIEGVGIVLEIDKSSTFYINKMLYVYFDINDSYYGPNSAVLDINKDFKIYTDRENINEYFKSIKCDLSDYISDMVTNRMKLGELHTEKLMELKKEEIKEK